jgi:hypothetical protein
MDKKASLWGRKGVRPDGVVQGYLGDCWFLATMSALAEKGDRIKNMFTNKEYTDQASKNGVF